MNLSQAGLAALVANSRPHTPRPRLSASGAAPTTTPASFPSSFDEAADQATTKLLEKAKPWIIGSLLVTALTMTISTVVIVTRCSR